jgi:hypothetical protein
MEKCQIEAHLDRYARKQIAEELRLLYGADEKLPENLLSLWIFWTGLTCALTVVRKSRLAGSASGHALACAAIRRSGFS